MERTQRRAGFTLIELLLVLTIIGIVTAVTVPRLVGSIRGQRLRVAARAVVMAGRFARSMAIMRQQEMTVALDVDRGGITVGEEAARLLEGVRIEYVETPDEDRKTEGVWQAAYRNNGRCTPYKVRLADDHGRAVLVEVDALGSARTERAW